VKSLGLTFPEIRRLREQNLKIFNLEMIKVKRVRLLTFFQGTTLSVLKQSILFILLWLIFHSVLTTGELVSMQAITAIIFVPLQDLGTIIVNYREAETSLSNFNQLMQKPVETRPENPIEIEVLNDIRFEEVVFRHRTARYNAIDGISFHVKTGETIAFVGPSGAGKSTLMKLLVGLYWPYRGEIYFNGQPSALIRYNPLRRQIGLVTQDSQLFSGTIRVDDGPGDRGPGDHELPVGEDVGSDGCTDSTHAGTTVLYWRVLLALSARCLLRRPGHHRHGRHAQYGHELHLSAAHVCLAQCRTSRHRGAGSRPHQRHSPARGQLRYCYFEYPVGEARDLSSGRLCGSLESLLSCPTEDDVCPEILYPFPGGRFPGPD